ncbi:MAG: hypothetical protein AMXMBFR53_29950 [Gemmatimonadota bacterium]
MSAERVVQQAVFEALDASATYQALVTGVFDGEAPQGTPYPYTVIGESTEVPDHVMEADGWDGTFTIHDWTDAKGRKVLQQIREARETILHNVRLTVSGYTLTTMRCEFAQVLPGVDQDGKTLQHQITRYRVSSLEA